MHASLGVTRLSAMSAPSFVSHLWPLVVVDLRSDSRKSQSSFAVSQLSMSNENGHFTRLSRNLCLTALDHIKGPRLAAPIGD